MTRGGIGYSVGIFILMFQRDLSTQSTKLQERNLLHKRIEDIAELQRVYDLGEVLGKGSFGTVIKASHKASGANWAIKIINKSEAGASRVMLVEREIHILKLVNHPNIILLDRVFESPKTIYLVFELCTGSLAKTFKVKKRFEETETLTVIRSLAGALSYLHKNDIVHRDLKLENILIAANPDKPDDKLHIKVTDFGLSAERGGTGYESMLHDCCGTLTYMAPEMIATKSYSQQCDVWSMGVIMYILIVGKFPFYSTNEQQLHLLVKTHELDFDSVPCSAEAKHLLSKMLQKNPAFRMTAAEVENHPWISGNHSRLQVESSNVLDMMRMWRTEMMDSPLVGKSGNTVAGQSSVNPVVPSTGLVHTATSEKKTTTGQGRNVSKSRTIDVQKFSSDSPYTNHRFWHIPPKSSTADASSSRAPRTPEIVNREAAIGNQPSQNIRDDPNDDRHRYLKFSDFNRCHFHDREHIRCNSETGIRPLEVVQPMDQKRRESSSGSRRSQSSRLTDFSHVQAKVDTNLANLRKEAQAQRKRGYFRRQS